MTQSESLVIVLPVTQLKKSSPNTIYSLFSIVNKGYEKPTNEYKIVLNKRIESPDLFFEDLGFSKCHERAFFYVLVDSSLLNNPQFASSFKKVQATSNYFEYSYTDNEQSLNFGFPFDQVLATVGYKPISNGSFEITGYTSFGKGCGVELFNKSLFHLTTQVNVTTLIAMVIVEHNLVGYYEKKLGFTEIERIIVKKTDPKSSGFQGNFKCAKDIHISHLQKAI
ncbi:hypothetical protein TPHA_0E02970 [Tetrapisispora phaffii CBS 4417]|uniref:Uncharacterized protein n=1 Tax=Tetrapisispora phaffii (strain ATCC 24235 / CBS 4417 / NBRC 1672 / NRRL Y-8282 / UCD 70-5) TaxID=1071381 RepID=G8BU09_TETPH|nr:hypothetical protein TPHA_0E02970 [Tetrapisispora phaffii CBS 4417]CCE63387.1 hypothetical protein TPHA_0E02970 [Tetrapisispora phaffii CBS 4417]